MKKKTISRFSELKIPFTLGNSNNGIDFIINNKNIVKVIDIKDLSTKEIIKEVMKFELFFNIEDKDSFFQNVFILLFNGTECKKKELIELTQLNFFLFNELDSKFTNEIGIS